METVQSVPDEADTTLDSVHDERLPPPPLRAQSVDTKESASSPPPSTTFDSSSRRLSDTNSNLITTNDILNHDYNQLKIDEGRAQRLNLKKENAMREDDLFITHVTLNLDIVENRPQSGSAWKYNAIKKNNTFAKGVKLNNMKMQNRPGTSRSTNSNQSKEPFLYLSTGRYSTNASECSDHIQTTQMTFSNSQLSNRTKYRISSREDQTSASQNFSQQRVNFENAAARKNRQRSSHNNQPKPVSYMDIIRTKSSADSSSSIRTAETHTFTSPSNRNTPRHSYSVAEYNKFKNSLLKNHSRNYYTYESINLNNECLKNNGEQRNENHKALISQTHPLFQQAHSISSGDNVDITVKPKPEKQLSQIKSIYETIQRANNSRIFSLEMRRSNYLNNIRNTNSILSSSLMVQKMSQRI